MFKRITILFFILTLAGTLSGQEFIGFNSAWAYFKGTVEPSQPNTLWRTNDFDASSWAVGNAPFRYGTGSEGTEITDMFGSFTTFYIRKNFQINSLTDFDLLQITASFDDGVVIWVNGTQLITVNTQNSYTYSQTATVSHDSGTPATYVFTKKEVALVTGTNLITIQCFNTSKTSTDFYIDAKVEGVRKLSEAGSVFIDKPSGFYTQNFTAKITTESTGDTVKYTLDGSDPGTSSTALTGTTPVNVSVNPASTQGGRGTTGGFVLRASKIQTGYEPGRPLTCNYIFLSAVKTQTHPGGSWPTSSINGQIIDLPMDTKVTNDSRYSSQVEPALKDIPTIAVSTDMDNLFNSQNGIYVNAEEHGDDWERPANVELINPDGSDGFNIDAGLRIRGGWSRHGDYPKHALRLFFRSDYGESKLSYPLFGSEGATEFDKIDLRTGQNYSWANGGDQAKYQTLNRDVFSRESQRDMDQPYTRSRFYHLYINGLYWGIYQTQERSEAAFAETYFGGDKDDYDVIKVDIGENFNLYNIEATDGNTDAWQKIWTMCQTGFAANLNYFKLLGLNASGERDTTLPVLVDVDNLIDYMLVIFYGGNFDAPVSKFSGNSNPNNFYAIYNRENKNQGFRFFAHDAEHTLLVDAVSPGIGLYENRVWLGSSTGEWMQVSQFSKFHPQWLHFRLTSNTEYRTRFADRVYKHFFNKGALTPDSCRARFKNTADKLNLAIIAESARWGDSKSGTARTKDDQWLPAVNQVLNDWIPYRSDIVIDQLINEKLYFTIQPPVFKHNGTLIADDKITISENYNITLENTNETGKIYYTINGIDPRASGGATSTSAISGGTSKSLAVAPGTLVKSRVKNESGWSALHEVYFDDSGLFSSLKITELHYHPADQNNVDGKELEFIEFKNTGDKTLDLSGLALTDGIQFVFPDGTTLAPGSFVVIVSNAAEFAKIYGYEPLFVYTGSLSNGGELVVLQTSSSQVAISFTYSDDAPWPPEADGDGYSLVSAEKNPTLNPDSASYWTISKYLNGSPGADDDASLTPVIQPEAWKQTFEIYPNPAVSDFYVDFSLNTGSDAEIVLFDLNGRILEVLTNENLPAGYHSKPVKPVKNYQPGIYLVALKTGTRMVTKKLVLQQY